MTLVIDVYIPVGGRCTLPAEGSQALEVFGNDHFAEEG